MSEYTPLRKQFDVGFGSDLYEELVGERSERLGLKADWAVLDYTKYSERMLWNVSVPGSILRGEIKDE
jgi:hypothetical protein